MFCTVDSQMGSNISPNEGDHSYTLKTEKQVSNEDRSFDEKTKSNYVAQSSKTYQTSDGNTLQKGLLKTSILSVYPKDTKKTPRKTPLILKKVSSPILNTKKYDAVLVDQTKVLNSLKETVGNVGDSPENPIIFKLDIDKSMNVIQEATSHMKVVEKSDKNIRVAEKRKLFPEELDLKEIPTKIQKFGSQSSIKLIKTAPQQMTNILVVDNPHINTSNRKTTPNQNITPIVSQKSSSQAFIANNRSNQPKVSGLVTTNTYLKKVDSASIISKEQLSQSVIRKNNNQAKVSGGVATSTGIKKINRASSILKEEIPQSPTSKSNNQATEDVKTYTKLKKIDSVSPVLKKQLCQPNVPNQISKKNELKEVDSPLTLSSTVVDLTNETPMSLDVTQQAPLEAEVDLPATTYTCLIRDCKGKKFFHVPKVAKEAFIWQICLLKTDKKRPLNLFSVEKDKVVCDQHFITEDFLEIPENGKVGVLKKHAVPSLHPVRNGCIIPGCVNQHRNTPNMYSIPVWRKCSLWLEYLPHLDNYDHFKLLTYRVCEEHFEEVSESNMFNLVPKRNLPSLQTLEDLRAKKLGVKPDDLCAFLLCFRMKRDSTFVPFPGNNEEASTWLELSFRDAVLCQDDSEVQKFLSTSPGLCPEHHVYITQYIGRNKKRQLEDGLSNVIDQIPILTTRLTLVNVNNKKIQAVKPTDQKPVQRKYYVPMREYCAFINCATHIKYATVKKYRFPTDVQLYNKWKELAGIHGNSQTDLSNYFVCGKHFTPSQFNSNGKLKVESVPQGYWLYKDENANDSNILWLRKLNLTRVMFNFLHTPPKDTASADTRREIANPPDNTKTMQKEKPKPPDNTSITRKPNLVNLSHVLMPIPKCCIEKCKVNASNGQLLWFPSLPSQKELFVKAILNKPEVSTADISRFNSSRICEMHFRPEDIIDHASYRANAVPTRFLNHEPDNNESNQDQDTTVLWEKLEESPSETQCHPQQMILYENHIEFPGMKRKLKFGKDCQKRGVNRFPYDIMQPFLYACSNVNPGHALQLDAALIIDDDDESERNAVALLRHAIMLNDKRTKKLTNRLAKKQPQI